MKRVPVESLFSADARVMQSSLIRQLTGLVNRADVISFATGSPNAEVFPHAELAEIFNDLVGREKGRIFQYSVTRGIGDLIEAVRERLARVKRIKVATEETILVSGSQQGLDLVARVLLDPGDVVLVERPNYIGATAAFQNFRAGVVGVDRTSAGMKLENLRLAVRRARSEGKKVKFVYVIPNFQNPSGHTWSVENRRGLLALASEEDFLIFEDDAYGEVYFSRADPERLLPIKSLDGEGRVIYMSTFSKILVPGLRVAWIAGDRDIVRRIELAKETADLCTSTLSQRMILAYLRRGCAEPHLEKVRRFYDHKCSVMQQSLERHLGELGRWNQPLGGLFLWVELQAAVDTLPLLQGAVEQEKVAYIPGSPFFVDGGGSNTLRLSFSNASDENIELGVRRLSGVFAAAAQALQPRHD